MPSSSSSLDRIRENVASRLRAGGFSPEVAGDDFDRICLAYATASTTSPVRDLMLQGTCGCGKTLAARILSKSRNFSLDFIDCANPVNVGWLDLSDNYTIGRIFERGFVLDDWGADKTANEFGVKSNPDADSICWYYSNTKRTGKPTRFPSIVTTNLTADDIIEKCGQRVMSRLAELFVICRMSGGDHREPIIIQ